MNGINWIFRPRFTLVRLCWAADNKMNFVLNYVSGAGLIARPVDQQSSALPLYHGCPPVLTYEFNPFLQKLSGDNASDNTLVDNHPVWIIHFVLHCPSWGLSIITHLLCLFKQHKHSNCERTDKRVISSSPKFTIKHVYILYSVGTRNSLDKCQGDFSFWYLQNACATFFYITTTAG